MLRACSRLVASSSLAARGRRPPRSPRGRPPAPAEGAPRRRRAALGAAAAGQLVQPARRTRGLAPGRGRRRRAVPDGRHLPALAARDAQELPAARAVGLPRALLPRGHAARDRRLLRRLRPARFLSRPPPRRFAVARGCCPTAASRTTPRGSPSRCSRSRPDDPAAGLEVGLERRAPLPGRGLLDALPHRRHGRTRRHGRAVRSGEMFKAQLSFRADLRTTATRPRARGATTGWRAGCSTSPSTRASTPGASTATSIT